MNQEKENPNFKLMHLRLLTNGSETEITESDILHLFSLDRNNNIDTCSVISLIKVNITVSASAKGGETPTTPTASPAHRPASARTPRVIAKSPYPFTYSFNN